MLVLLHPYVDNFIMLFSVFVFIFYFLFSLTYAAAETHA